MTRPGPIFSLALLAGLFASILVFFFWQKIPEAKTEADNFLAVPSPITNQPNLPSQPNQVQDSIPTFSTKIWVKFENFDAPTSNKYRAEVAQNPHDTPPSLVQMARDVSEASEKLKKDSGLMAIFKNDLITCSNHPEITPVAKKFCKEFLRDLSLGKK